MNANDTQVAGNHYQSTYQHWDLVHDAKLGYFEGQITKYITRHRSKNGVEDIMKARHYTLKLLDLVRKHDYKPKWYPLSLPAWNTYVAANKLGVLEHVLLMSACGWTCPQDLEMLFERLTMLVREYDRATAPEIEHMRDTGEPGPAYVNQG